MGSEGDLKRERNASVKALQMRLWRRLNQRRLLKRKVLRNEERKKERRRALPIRILKMMPAKSTWKKSLQLTTLMRSKRSRLQVPLKVRKDGKRRTRRKRKQWDCQQPVFLPMDSSYTAEDNELTLRRVYQHLFCSLQL